MRDRVRLDGLAVDRLGALGLEAPPVLHLRLSLLEEGAVAALVEQRLEALQRELCIAAKPHVDWITHSDSLGAVVNLYARGRTGRGEELYVRAR